MRLAISILFALCVAAASTATAGPFEDGVAAYDKGDFATALALWRPLAEQGDAAAAFNVAHLYEKGEGAARDETEASRWYLVAANKGDTDAELEVARRYEIGTGFEKDASAAARWYEAVIASPRQDAATARLKTQARERVAALSGATQEIVAYDAGRFVLVRARDGTCVIAMQGAVTHESSEKFDDVVARSAKLGCDKPWVMLESPGGFTRDGLDLGTHIRDAGFRTITRYACASSCAFIFMGGVDRVLAGSRAKIGLHQQAIFRDGGKSKTCIADFSDMRSIRNFLWWVLPAANARRVLDIILATPCTSIRYVGGKDALDLGIATAVEGEHDDIFGPLASHAAPPSVSQPPSAPDPSAAAPALPPAAEPIAR
jgi:hypothetical protein